MPIYEYVCQSCQKQFEHLHRTMTGDTRTNCPDCGSSKTVRALSVFAVAAHSDKSSGSSPPTCGHCGGAPGSCQS